MGEREARISEESMASREDAPALPPPVQVAEPAKSGLHPAVYIATWIGLSSSVIVFNKWILDRKGFAYPITLTTWHLIFSTIVTQIMARFTTILDSRKKVPMTGRIYMRAIVPIGIVFSMSLMYSNYTYLYLSVSFIQMLKATTPVATLLATWALRIQPPSMKTLYNVTAIVVGVIIASFGEIKFVLIGFIFAMLGVICEATRLAMVQRLLSGSEFKMDPLVSLYYFAPVCACMNGLVALFVEGRFLSLDEVAKVGFGIFFLNALVAFLLNVAVVMLIGKAGALALTLSGVLKDILLALFSMLIFLDPVTGLQAFGYSIALGGLIYYKLGKDKIMEHFGDAQRYFQNR